MGCLIAIDPGNVTGWAVFRSGVLEEAGRTTPEKYQQVFAQFPDATPVIEIPMVYPRGGKGDPNDLIKLAIVAGKYAGFLEACGSPFAQFVKPVQWKGSVPKDIHQRRILKKLQEVELERLPKRPRAKNYDHNMLDAVGIGLWKLGRL